MKKILLGLSFCVTCVCMNAQKSTTPVITPSATAVVKPVVASVVSFDKLKFSFGKIKQGTPKGTIFTLKNTGSKPLIIEQATAQCGCTTPEYSKAPILKGKSSPIKVTYNAANPGPFTKTVTVKFLGVAEPSILTIEGEVLKNTEAPAKG